jgi:diaminopimelate decarboxylase
LSKNNHNAIKDLLQLAEFGSPLYVYDAEKIQSQYNRLTKAFSKVEKLRINYAMKALSNVAILQLLKEMGRIDTVSIQEVQLGLHAGYDPEKYFTLQTEYLSKKLKKYTMGVQINIDNLSILEQLAKHPHVPVCIRINLM